MAAFDATKWVFKVQRPGVAWSDEVETGVARTCTLVEALSIAEVESGVVVSSTPDEALVIVAAPRSDMGLNY